MYTTIKNRFLPYFGVLDSGKIALVVASVMGGYVLLLNNSPCIDAQSTCQIGSTNEFTGNISIAGGTSHKGTLDASNLTNDRTYTFPDQDGTFLMGSAFTGNKMIGTSPTGSLETVDTYPKTFGGVTDANKYVTLNGAGTEIIANSTTIPLADISLTTGSPNALMGIDSTNSTVEYKLLSTIPLEGFDTSSATVGQFLKAGANTGVWQNIDPTVDLSVGTGTAGQLLTVNSGGTAIEWSDPSGGGGSFTATASQNVVAGAVGLESNGQVRNVTTLQNGVTPLGLGTLTESTSGQGTKMHAQKGLYNSNADAMVYVYREFDANQTPNCDTHLYVDVVQENNGSLQKWGRQCLSNQWSNHTATQPSAFESSGSYNGDDILRFARYGSTYDESIDNYVIIYYAGSGNSGQLYTVPFSIDSSTSTITVGTETLLIDRHLCYQNQSCTTTPTTTNYVGNSLPMIWDNNQSFMVAFYNMVNSNSWYQGYSGNKSFTCTGFGGAGASCSPYANWENHNWLSGTWTQYTQIMYPQIFYDTTAQIFVAIVNYSSQSQDCRVHSFSYNQTGGINPHNSNTILDTNGYTESNGDPSQNITTYSVYCNPDYNMTAPAYDSVNDLYLVTMQTDASYQSYWDFNMNFFFITADRTTPTASPVVVAKYDLQNRLADLTGVTQGTFCQNVTNEKCLDRAYQIEQSNWVFEPSTSKFSIFSLPLLDNNTCPTEGYNSTCSKVLEFQMDNTTNTIDISTIKEYEYFDGSNYYNFHPDEPQFLWKDAQGTFFSAQAFSYLQQGATQGMYSASAFVIPDNISDWIGHITQPANSGSQVTVLSVGAVLDGLSGLTIGTEYYVKADGTLGTSGTYKVGRAIATDKIYITNAR